MASLMRSQRTRSWVLGIVACVGGFLLYDATASPRGLHRSDCEELAATIDHQLRVAERFIESDPPRWQELAKFYRSLERDLNSYHPHTEAMKRETEDLREHLDTLAFHFANESVGGKHERLREAQAELRSQLQELRERCR